MSLDGIELPEDARVFLCGPLPSCVTSAHSC